MRSKGKVKVLWEQRSVRCGCQPLDPRRSYYEALASAAANSAGKYERATELAQRSLRVNSLHASALRNLAIAQVHSGRVQEARETVGALLRIEPSLTVSAYLRRNPAAGFASGKRWAEALRVAGLPE